MIFKNLTIIITNKHKTASAFFENISEK